MDREAIARIIDPTLDLSFDPDRGAVQNDIDRAAKVALAKADAILALLASPSPNPQEAEGWKPMADAPRGTYFEPWTATPILAKLKSPIPRQGRPDLEPWAGRYVVVQHTGISPDGFDIGWNVAAPVGAGGLPDEWFVGWRPIEDAASPTPQEAQAEEKG